MELCAKCKKNPAVLFITKMEGGKTTSEGLCLSCAKELGIAPLNNMINQFGVADEELDSLNTQMSEFIENLGGMKNMDGNMNELMQELSGGEDDEGGAATAPLSEFFGNMFGADAAGDGNTKTDTKRKKQKNKKSLLDTYGTNLTAKAALG